MITEKAGVSKESMVAEMDQLASRLNLSDVGQAKHFPKYFQIETVRVCNARCPFCGIDQWDKSVPLMSETLFNKIADEICQHADWVETVNVQRAGEPLLDKKLASRIQRFKEGGIRKIALSTNASLLNEKRATDLFQAGLDDIMLSIDSIDKEPYERMRVGLKYETVMANIETLFRVRDEIKPDAVVRVRGVCFHDLNNPEQKKEVERWENFWGTFKKPHDRIYMKQIHNWGNQVAVPGATLNYGEIYHPCILPFSTMHVTSMGIVPLCSMDYDGKFNMGDLNQQSIREIWQNERWELVRGLHRTGSRNEIFMCQGCKLFDLDFSMEKKGALQGSANENDPLHEGADM